MERVKPDYSVGMTIDGSEERYLLDPRYDFIRLFPWLQYGIVNIVTETGIHRLYTTEEQCMTIHERTRIPLAIVDFIVESEYENMVEIMANDLNDSWLEGNGEHPILE